MKRLIAVLLCAVITLGVFAGCSSLHGDEDKGAIVPVFLTSEVYDFDPQKDYTDNSAMKYFSLIYEGLTKIGENGKWEKALMKSYTTTEEYGEYILRITLNHTSWSDGRRVQAQDIVYSWKRALDPSFGCSAASMLYDIKNAKDAKMGNCSIDDVGISSIDTYVLEIRFDYKVDYDAFFYMLASPALVPLREDVVANNSDDWAKKTSTIVTNGPFAMKEIIHGVRIRLDRNQYYFRDREKKEVLDKYVRPWRILIYYDKETLQEQLDSYNNQNIFYMGELPLNARAELEKKAEVSDELSTHTYYFNYEHTLFQNVNVRRALSMALDRNHIVELVTFAKPATGIISGGVFNTTRKTDFRKTADKKGVLVSSSADLEGAKALLSEAGVRSGSFTITVRDNEIDVAIANYAAETWNSLGFNVKVRALGARSDYDSDGNIYYVDQYNKAYSEKDYDVIALDMQMLSTDAYSNLSVFAEKFSGQGVDMSDKDYPVNGHITGYKSDEYNNIIDSVFECRNDASARADLLHQAEEYLINDMAVMPIVFWQDAYLINTKKLSGEKTTYYGNRIFNKLKLKNYLKTNAQLLED